MLAVDVRLDHREVLEIGAAVADRLQLVAMIKAGDVLRRDAAFRAERITAPHLVGRQEVHVALQRVGADGLKAGIRVREEHERQ